MIGAIPFQTIQCAGGRLVSTYVFKNVGSVRLGLFNLAEDRCPALTNEHSLAWLDITHVGEPELSQGDTLRGQPAESVNKRFGGKLSKGPLGERLDGVA